MTSLFELCTNEEERKVAEHLTEHGIVTDRDMLLADNAVLKQVNIPQFVTPAASKATHSQFVRHSMASVRMYYT
jgi:hypothetical protein